MTLDNVLAERSFGEVPVIGVPSLVKGRLLRPAWPTIRDLNSALASHRRGVAHRTGAGSYLIVEEASGRDKGEKAARVLVIDAPQPDALCERDPAAAIRELMSMKPRDVYDFVDAVGKALQRLQPRAVPDWAAGERVATATHAQIGGMFRGDQVRLMVETELGPLWSSALDRWTPAASPVVQGITSRMATGHGTSAGDPCPHRALIRGIPTTQLHITAGNTALVPATSLLWAWAARGACVLKSAAGTIVPNAAIAAAIAAVDPGHPLARHTSVVYWRGGDEVIEQKMLARGAFQKRVVWGSSDTVSALAGTGGGTDTVVMRPRHAMSIVARSPEGRDLAAMAELAATDSVVADQRACMSSLLHVVEGDDRDAEAYAIALADALASWDHRMPPGPSARAVQGSIVQLRRGLLADGTWLLDRGAEDAHWAVVRTDRSFDLTRHPGGRLVVVRASTEPLRVVESLVATDISHVGIAPEGERERLRDALVSMGVDNVLPLGQAERIFAGRPHDGMQILHRLIRWVSA